MESKQIKTGRRGQCASARP